jgi:calnexin
VIELSSSNIFFEEQFQEKDKWSYWMKSEAKKDGVEEHLAKYDGEWAFEMPQSSVYKNNYGLVLKVMKKNKRSSIFFFFV